MFEKMIKNHIKVISADTYNGSVKLSASSVTLSESCKMLVHLSYQQVELRYQQLESYLLIIFILF